jgi:hypothetical protein
MAIVCEGEKTEPSYIQALLDELGLAVTKVKVVDEHGVPATLVALAIDLQKPSNGGYEEVWVVFDRDGHPKVSESLNRALQKGVRVAFSNPCVELWFCLHYACSTAERQRDEAIGEAERLLAPAGIRNVKSDNVYAAIKSLTRVAVANARRLAEHHHTAGSEAMCAAKAEELAAKPGNEARTDLIEWCTANPSTGMYHLVERLLARAAAADNPVAPPPPIR